MNFFKKVTLKTYFIGELKTKGKARRIKNMGVIEIIRRRQSIFFLNALRKGKSSEENKKIISDHPENCHIFLVFNFQGVTTKNVSS